MDADWWRVRYEKSKNPTKSSNEEGNRPSNLEKNNRNSRRKYESNNSRNSKIKKGLVPKGAVLRRLQGGK